MKRRVALSAISVIVIGSSLHFTWELSGRNPIAAVFSAINESTWEHLKMAFWPALALTPFLRWLYGRLPGTLPGTAIRCLLSPLLIVILFHGYIAILGNNFLALDVGIFIIAVIVAEWAGDRMMQRRSGEAINIASAALLVVAVTAFSTLSFYPPDNFLFKDPHAVRHLALSYSGGRTDPRNPYQRTARGLLRVGP